MGVMISPMPRSERLPVTLSVRVSTDQWSDLEELADQLGVDVSVVVRAALRLGLQEAGQELDRDIEAHIERASKNA